MLPGVLLLQALAEVVVAGVRIVLLLGVGGQVMPGKSALATSPRRLTLSLWQALVAGRRRLASP